MMIRLKKHCAFLLIYLSQVAASFPSECKDLVLYSIFGTFGGCLFISSFILFIVIRRRKINVVCNQKSMKAILVIPSKKTQHYLCIYSTEHFECVKGKRNKLYEEDVICRVRKKQDNKFELQCNESIIPFPKIFQLQKFPSMPNLAKHSSLVKNYENNSGKINSTCSSDILNCLQIKQFRSFGAQTDCLSNLIPTDCLCSLAKQELLLFGISEKKDICKGSKDKHLEDLKVKPDMDLSIEKVIVEKKTLDCVGLDFGIAGVYIKKVFTDEVSFKLGHLVAGDEIVSINGDSVFGLNAAEVFSIFVKSNFNVFLEIRKGAFLSKVSNELQAEVQNEKIIFNGFDDIRECSRLNNINGYLSTQQLIPVTLDCLPEKQDKLIRSQSIEIEDLPNTSDFSTALEEIESDCDPQGNKTFFSQVLKEKLKSDIQNNHVESASKNVVNETLNKKIPNQSHHNRASSNESLQINTKKICPSLCRERFNRTQSEENIPLNINSQLKRSFSHDNQTYEQPCYGYTQKKIQYLYDDRINYRLNDGELNELFVKKSNNGDYLNVCTLNNNRNDMIVKRGYNYDYIVPVASCVPVINNIHNTRFSCQKNKRLTGINYNKQNDDSTFLFSLPSQSSISNNSFLNKDSGRVSYSTKNPPSYESSQQNTTLKDLGIIDYMNFNEVRYSCNHAKEPPFYSDPPLYSDCFQVINILPDDNLQQSKNKSIPLPYDVNIETKCNKKYADVKADSIPKRSYPKRTNSMPAVRHIDERSRIAKTFLIDEDIKTPKKLQNKLIKSAYCNRRKSIDSGTLKKLAVELQNNPEFGCEYPMISQLLCESQFTAIERRGKNLYRHKSTEAISTRSYDTTVEFL